MKQSCWVCANLYSGDYRGWYEYLVPRVCSNLCFQRWVNEAHVPIEINSRDQRIEMFHHSPKEFRSNYERRFSDYLFEHRSSLSSDYEPFVFTLADKSRYVPDFLVSASIFIEVKGIWTSEGKKKVLAFRDQFPEFPLMVLDDQALRLLAKTAKANR